MSFYRNTLLRLISLLLVAFALRAHAAQQRPLWYDETTSFFLAENGVRAILAGTLGGSAAGAAAEEHPILFHVLLSGWLRLVGESPFAMRLLPVFAGLLTVAVAERLAALLFRSQRAGLIGAAFVSFAPFPVHYSQELRMYALLALWLLLAALALLRGLRRDRRRDWSAFAVFAALAQYTHALAGFYLAPLALTPLFLRRRRALRKTALAAAAALLLYLPWLVVVPAQVGKVQGGFWIERPGAGELARALLVFTSNLPLPFGAAGLAFALFVSLLALALALQQTLRRQPGAAPTGWLLYLSAAPLLLLFLVSQLIPVYIERALLASGVVYALALAAGLTALRLPRAVARAALLGLAALAAMGLFMHFHYQGFPYAPFVELTEYIDAVRAPEDALVHSNKLTFLPAHYYARDLPQTFVADPAGSGADTLSPATQAVFGVSAAPSIAQAVNGAPRVWFVIFAERAISEYRQLGFETHPQIGWLEANYALASTTEFGEAVLYEYVQP